MIHVFMLLSERHAIWGYAPESVPLGLFILLIRSILVFLDVQDVC
jgi:hypothetical protein